MVPFVRLPELSVTFIPRNTRLPTGTNQMVATGAIRSVASGDVVAPSGAVPGGDVGRYRHPAPTCAAFRAARPKPATGLGVVNDGRIKGHSYPQDWYEDAIGSLLTQIGRIDDWAISEVVRLHADHRPRADELTLARIARSREDAARRLAKTRDLVAWTATMARLDAEEALAHIPLDSHRLGPGEIVEYLRSLPTLWADSGTAGRQAIVSAIFSQIDVLGYERLEYELSADAIDLGLDAALPPIMELKGKVAEFGRGERDSPATTDLPITMRLAEPPEPFDWLQSA